MKNPKNLNKINFKDNEIKNNFTDFLKEELKNPEIKKEYDNLEFKYKLIRMLIEARIKENLTQKELADRIGIAQSNISRFESGNYNPTLQFIEKILQALGKKIELVDLISV
jgi:DNA-binding XRE family transcriptional regulator